MSQAPRLAAPLWLRPGIAAVALCVAAPALAQHRPARDNDAELPIATPAPAPQSTARGDEIDRGRVADSSVGRAGKRKSRNDVQGAAATTRINNRISNRVQTRVSNRIDAYYDPLGDAARPFEAAEERARRKKR